MKMKPNNLTMLLLFLKVLIGEGGKVQYSKVLYNLTNEIVTNYFSSFKCTTLVVDNEKDLDIFWKGRSVFVIKMKEFKKNMPVEKHLMKESYEQGCGGYVIHSLSKNWLSMILQLKKAKSEAISYRYTNQRYLFVPTENDRINITFLYHKIMYFFPNILVIVPKKNSSDFLLLSHTTFDLYKKSVLKLKYEVLDKWSHDKGFEKKTDLFKNKIKNVMGKKLRFSLMHYVPYTLILRSKNETKYDGLEPRIAATFVKVINGTWDAEDQPVELWGDFSKNGTANGILGAVQRHSADFGFAAIYQWNCFLLDCSFSYIQAGVTCMVPRPLPVSGWTTILIPFQGFTWLCLGMAYFLISFFVLFLTVTTDRIRGNVNTKGCWDSVFEAFFNVFRLQLEQIPKLAQKASPVSTYIRISTLYYYFVAAFWQGIIATVLMIPQYEQPIDTAHDLIKNYPQVKWGGNHVSWIEAITDAMDPVLITIIDKYVVENDEELEKRPAKRNFGFFMERMPHGHFGFNDYINHKTMPYLRIMKENVYIANVVTVMPRDCPYAEYYDYILSWMFDTGLVHKIEDQVSLEMIDNRLQLKIRTSNDKERHEGITLAIRHLEGPLYIYIFGILVSTLVFIFEKIIWSRY